MASIRCWNSTTPEPSSKPLTSVPASDTIKHEGSGNQLIKVSKAMKAYQEKAQALDALMFEKTTEYEIGRRHLANMMGEDPETFTDEDIDTAIEYLFPSGLFEPRARPLMKHPTEVFARKKVAEFDETGRPFHVLFYTGLPNYYQVLHDLSEKVRELDSFSDRMMQYNIHKDPERTLNVGGTEWVKKEQLEDILLEKLKDKQYEFFVRSMNRLLDHPFSYRVEEFIMKFRKHVQISVIHKEIPKLMFTAEGTPYMAAVGRRKTSTASVTVYGRGSGKISINGEDLLYFKYIQDREQVLFPLQFSGLLGKVDVVADVDGGGFSGQSGAIRYAISMAVRSFVDEQMMEKMRLAGLLTRDPRRHERKKPGWKGARAKYTWKKR
ncbi:small ribosomal subunit protein uS9m isoform X2 [Cherax quadricarinatus]|uniref:small ribosomal subunit protein uS9m isoform X2 n=1 Tax=Cherax quadricarinatus TaxID=27406 RepID=UPI002379B43C|nr:28S ribosomal protein S9, mitochondrial-like isoform X2 [Cherax quadricarinatus]